MTCEPITVRLTYRTANVYGSAEKRYDGGAEDAGRASDRALSFAAEGREHCARFGGSYTVDTFYGGRLVGSIRGGCEVARRERVPAPPGHAAREVSSWLSALAVPVEPFPLAECSDGVQLELEGVA